MITLLGFGLLHYLLSCSEGSPHIEAKGGISPHGVLFDCIGGVSVAVSDTVPDAVSAGVYHACAESSFF